MINDLGHSISQSLEAVTEGALAFDAACIQTHGELGIAEITAAQAAQVTELQAANAGALGLATSVARGIAAAAPAIETGKNDFLYATTYAMNHNVLHSRTRLRDLAKRAGGSSDNDGQTPLEASTALVAQLEEIGALTTLLQEKLTAAHGLAQFIVETNRPPLGPSVVGDVSFVMSDMRQYRKETGIPLTIPTFFDS